MTTKKTATTIETTATTASIGEASRFAPRLMALLLLLLVAPFTVGYGCADRTYLTKSHGRAYGEAFDRQTVNPHPRRKPGVDPTEGLDSQEAAAVAGSYRRSLKGKEGAAEGPAQPMVIMSPNAGGQPGSYMPGPSVPGGQ